jgi:cytochrome c553
MRQSLLYVVLAAVTVTVSLPAGAEDWTPRPAIVKAKGEECVQPTDVMRKRHFEFILPQRDETEQKGSRTERYYLTECIECHATRDESGTYLPIDAKGQFCESCHRYAAVSIDCFQCHESTKEAPEIEAVP